MEATENLYLVFKVDSEKFIIDSATFYCHCGWMSSSTHKGVYHNTRSIVGPSVTHFKFSLLPSFCLSLPLLHSSQIVWQINHPSILQEGLLCSRWCQCKHLEGAYLVSRLTISVDSRIENINSNRKGKNTLLDSALPPPSYHPSFQSKT